MITVHINVIYTVDVDIKDNRVRTIFDNFKFGQNGADDEVITMNLEEYYKRLNKNRKKLSSEINKNTDNFLNELDLWLKGEKEDDW